ncbi:hypothetical protein [Kitasatospora sp. NPDC059571]|uniref:hypothetical protein n=1 Tax=Kitasatospora sp. NPDC059571 TaxID=3346871 RepID=UPI00367C4C20
MKGQDRSWVMVPMPVVFVHGVGNHGEEQQAGQAAKLRRQFFAEFLLPAIGADPGHGVVLMPWWGRAPALPRWGRVCRPGASEALGSGDRVSLVKELAAAEPPPTGRTDDVVLDTARESVADAVDLLYSAVDVDACTDEDLRQLATLAVPLASYCERHRRFDPTDPFWEDVADDPSLIRAFTATGRTPGPQVETLGGGGPPGRVGKLLRRTADELRKALVGPPVRLTAGGLRRLTDIPVHDYLADVFKYLAERGTPEQPGEIVGIVLDDLRKATADAPADEPLVVVAHSMGGNIVYDIASHFCPKLTIDMLVTVGSQVGLFAEFSAFQGVPGDLPVPGGRRKVPARENIRTWINIVDRGDILGYSAKPVFEGVEDYDYESGALWAHSAYFKQPNFHRRLARRVRGATA